MKKGNVIDLKNFVLGLHLRGMEGGGGKGGGQEERSCRVITDLNKGRSGLRGGLKGTHLKESILLGRIKNSGDMC